MNDIMQKVQEVNKLLLAGEPSNISVDDHSGYTGYKPQHIIDIMNEVFGLGGWGFEEVSSEISPGEKGGLAVAQVRVWLKDVPDFHPTSYGQNRVTRGDVGDAKKGAQTDAIKKALSYFSIGNRAYHGLLNVKSQPQASQKPRSNGTSHNSPGEYQTVSRPSGGQGEPNNSNIAPLIAKAKERAKALGMASNLPEWYAFLQECLGEVLASEKDITLDRIARVNGKLTAIEKERKATA